ncbi:pre-mRNA-splicing factor SLU7 [Gossypium australe]|uniref:Pre-mRNA-splicing factor SLU7 n=1 Tax=Gossypium australe TaxID=47621 RepID=A0A5B6VBW2_9ROSI|nr:pre-mRNA-splicing factor SLU7 [Gossypium australe]
MDFAKLANRVPSTGGGSTGTQNICSLQYKTRICVFGKTAKYLLNLDIREDPLPDADPNELYGGDNQYRMSGQALEFKQLNIHAWEAFDKGQDIHMQAAPSQAELLFRNYKVIKGKVK